jgi:hypothetical protein
MSVLLGDRLAELLFPGRISVMFRMNPAHVQSKKEAHEYTRVRHPCGADLGPRAHRSS